MDSPEKQPVAATLPPFDPLRWRRRRVIDQALRGVILTLLAVAALWVVLVSGQNNPVRVLGVTLDSMVLILALALPWFGLNLIGVKASYEAQHTPRGADRHDVAAAEAGLARASARWPVSRRVHVIRLRQWAALRHHQKRHDEATIICRELLTLDRQLQRDTTARAEMLLLWAESALECGQLGDAYHSLTRLHGMPLPLQQRLARMLLQTRYEVILGAHAAALYAWDRKVDLAELLPYPLSGQMHAYLAVAARQVAWHELADWLTARAKLLAPRAYRSVVRQVGGSPAVAVPVEAAAVR